jgi:hypothetical protein
VANQSKKQTAGKRNDDRKCGKAPKQNPKEPNAGATGRSVGGYSPAALARRAARRSAQVS